MYFPFPYCILWGNGNAELIVFQVLFHILCNFFFPIVSPSIFSMSASGVLSHVATFVIFILNKN